jgi:hypothetical protein
MDIKRNETKITNDWKYASNYVRFVHIENLLNRLYHLSVIELPIYPTTSSTPLNESNMHIIIQNLTDSLKSTELDDYPNDNEVDYSDYAYEDSTSEMSTTTTTTTTTIRSSTIITTTTSDDDDIAIDDTNTAYYDYGDHDLYSDDEVEETSTTEEPIRFTTTKRMTVFDWKDRIPFYHRRPPIIWNVNKDDDEKSSKQEQRYNSGSFLNYSLLLQLIIFISRV